MAGKENNITLGSGILIALSKGKELSSEELIKVLRKEKFTFSDKKYRSIRDGMLKAGDIKKLDNGKLALGNLKKAYGPKAKNASVPCTPPVPATIDEKEAKKFDDKTRKLIGEIVECRIAAADAKDFKTFRKNVSNAQDKVLELAYVIFDGEKKNFRVVADTEEEDIAIKSAYDALVYLGMIEDYDEVEVKVVKNGEPCRPCKKCKKQKRA